jgi:hypothetical protein
MRLLLSALALGVLWACGDAPATTDLPAQSPEELRRALCDDAALLLARGEHHAPTVTVQHLLVGVRGAVPAAQRSAEEAEALAAELYARAKAGEDFDVLAKNFSDDPTIEYAMSLETPSLEPGATSDVYPRARMKACLGDVAWRLSVGEIGAALFDGASAAPRSPYGYDLVKRLK